MSKIGKTVIKSNKSGVGIFRDKDGLLTVGLGRGADIKGTCIIEEDENNTPIMDSPRNTGTFCGSISPNDLSSILDLPPAKGPVHAGAVLRSAPNDENVEPVLECVSGLIVSMVDGYYLFVVDPNPDISYMPYYQYLGDNDAHDCIVNLIGTVVKHDFLGVMTCRVSRWAFEDRVRQFTQSGMYEFDYMHPMYPPFDGDYNQTFSYTRDGYFTPHYGVFQGRGGHLQGSGANLAGCGETETFIRWAKNYYLVSLNDSDYQIWDSQGIDVPYYPFRSVRIGQLSDVLLCETFEPPEGENNDRFRYIVNYDRQCVNEVDTLVDDPDTEFALAEAHADNMALYDFVDSVDYYSGTEEENDTGVSLVMRAAAAGVNYDKLNDILGAVTGEIGAVDEAVDDLFALFKGKIEDYKELMADYYIKISFAMAFNITTYKWYGCCILRTTIEDGLFAISNKVLLPKTPNADGGFFVDSSTVTVSDIGDCYRAFSTVPSEYLWLSCLGYQKFKFLTGNSTFGYITIKARDYSEFPITYNQPLVAPQPEVLSFLDVEHPAVVYPEVWTYGGSYKRRPYYDVAEYSIYYVEYDNSPLNRSIYLRLGNIDVDNSDDNCVFNGDQFWRTQTRPYLYGDILPNGDEYLEDEEEEPFYITAHPYRGYTELWVGDTYINNASDTSAGQHTNPFQSIVVASTFHSNSGYTTVLYTRTKTLMNLANSWKTELDPEFDEDDVSERYFWLKETLWCAVVNPDGDKIADFKVRATIIPEEEDDLLYYEIWYYETHQEPIENIQNDTFIIQTDGEIELESVHIHVTIHGNKVYIFDTEEGLLFEEPNQVSDVENVLSESTINYKAGIITLKFSTNPDPDSELKFEANVWPFDKLKSTIDTYVECVHYEAGKSNYSSGYEQMGLIETIGFQATAPNISITEDGRYLVVGFRIGQVRSDRFPRLRSPKTINPNNPPDEGEYFSLWPWLDSGYTSRRVDVFYNDNLGHEVVIYDLQTIASEEPEMVARPFLIERLKRVSETLVLN